jgi:hypothetical protein
LSDHGALAGLADDVVLGHIFQVRG